MDVEAFAISIRDTIKDFPKLLEENSENLKKVQGEINDLLHLLEMTKFNAYEGYKTAADLQVLLAERRKIKDQYEQLKHLKPVFNQWSNGLKKADTAIAEIQNQKNVIEHRSYQCRVRKDLENKINGVKEVPNV